MKKLLLAGLITMLLLSSISSVYAEVKDLHKSSDYSRAAIASLDKLKAVDLDDAGNFNPKTNITRAAFVKMLVIAIGDIDPDEYNYESKIFTDISTNIYHSSSKYYKYIMAAYFNELISGSPNKTFNPNRNITREEMACIFYNILVPVDNREANYSQANLAKFKDRNKVSTWAQNGVGLMVSTGLMVGTAADAFDPKGNVTKEQAAVIINKYITQKAKTNTALFNGYNTNSKVTTYYAIKGVKIHLDGGKSILGNDGGITNTWKIDSKPYGSAITLNTGNKIKPYFIPDKTGTYTVVQTATNGKKSYTAKFTVIVEEPGDSTDNINTELYKNNRKNSMDLDARTVVPLSDGWFIAGDIIRNKIIIANVLTGETGKEYQIEFIPSKVQYDPEKNVIIACQAWEGNRSNGNLPKRKIVKIDMNTDKISYIDTSYRVRSLTFGEDNIVFAYMADMSYEPGAREKVALIDIEAEKEIGLQNVSAYDISFMAYDRYTDSLFMAVEGLSPSSLYKYHFDKSSNNLSLIQVNRDAGTNGHDLSISNDGKHIAFVCGGGNDFNRPSEGTHNYTVYDINSSDIMNNLNVWGVGPYPKSADFSKDNKYVVISNTHEFRIHDLSRKSPVNVISYIDKNEEQDIVRYSQGGKLIFHLYGGKLYYYIV